MASLKEFTQLVKVVGVDEAVRALREVGDETVNLGEATGGAGKEGQKAESAFGDLSGTLDRGVQSVLSMAGGFLGAAGLTAAMRSTREEADKSREALEKFVDAMASTLALTKDPEFLKIASNASIESGRPITEIGTSIFTVTSALGSDTELVKSIIAEATELSKAEPKVPFDQFVDLGVSLRLAAGDKLTPQQGQNFSIKTEEFSRANIGDIAANIPGVVARGLPAGMSLSDVGALYATATGTLSPQEARTASQNIITRLAAPSPESEKLFAELGIPEGSGVIDIISALAKANQKQPLDTQQFKTLVGEGPGAAILPVLLRDIEKFQARRKAIAEATKPGAPDLGAEQLGVLRNILPGFSELDRTRQMEQRLEETRRSSGVAIEEQIAAAIRLGIENAMIEERLSPIARLIHLKKFDAARGLGFDPVTSLDFALPTGIGEDSLDKIGERDRIMQGILQKIVPEANISADDLSPRPPSFGRLIPKGSLLDDAARSVYDDFASVLGPVSDNGLVSTIQDAIAKDVGEKLAERELARRGQSSITINNINTQYNDQEARRMPEPDVDLND